jgi:hypothetical protein
MVPWDRPGTTGATAAPGYLTSGALQSVWVTFSSFCRQKVTWDDCENTQTGPRAGKLATAATQRCHEIILARLGPPLRRVISLQVYFNPFGSLFRHFVIKRSPGKAVKTRKRALGPESSSQQSLHSSWCHGIALTRLGPPLRRVISLQVHFNPFGSLFRHFVVKRSPGKAVKTRTRALVALRGGIRAGKLITALTSPWDRPGATGAIAAPGYHKFHVL